MFRFTIRQIEIFLKVCEAEGFRRASDALGISEAAISHQICLLEEQLGGALFRRRRGAAIQLLPEGEEFREAAILFVRQGLALGQRLAPAAPHPTSITIHTGPHLLEDALRPALPDFLRRHPDINLNLVLPKARRWLKQAILADKVQGALLNVKAADELPHSDLLAQTEMALFACPTIAARIRANPALPIDLLLPNSEHPDAAAQIRYLRHAGVHFRIAGHYPFHDVGIRMAAEGGGALVVLTSIVTSLAPAGLLERVQNLGTWQTRLYLSPHLRPDHALALRQFFTTAAVGLTASSGD
ncbi:DNA-binding transcriptional LysR family regulator [Novosphingobium sp. SG751A]|uniref:LysR family transcriptional regulator n=1 Tax=Novosphingobium sp. SG751A TaxID=2587000 RepID=UPI00155265B8|nr:LysR family transcriptional regulator [Novosphingobium sp. SG751A]NOW47370.1 DNA-binding transcriptional LysR family regulator [Novosphingobium sp. SG751A]